MRLRHSDRDDRSDSCGGVGVTGPDGVDGSWGSFRCRSSPGSAVPGLPGSHRHPAWRQGMA